MRTRILCSLILVIMMTTPTTTLAHHKDWGRNCDGTYEEGGRCEWLHENVEGLIAIGFGLLVGITLFIACEEGDATISECFEDKENTKSLIETIQSSPIQPMLYVDDQEQKLGLRYTIRF